MGCRKVTLVTVHHAANEIRALSNDYFSPAPYDT